MPGGALRFFPHPQCDVSGSYISREQRIARILFENSFELVQTARPLALPAMNVTGILQRSDSVRLQLECALELRERLFVLPIPMVIKIAERDVRFGEIGRKRECVLRHAAD